MSTSISKLGQTILSRPISFPAFRLDDIIEYAPATLINHLIIGSYLFLLNALAWIVDRYTNTGLVVQIIIGLIYGPPLCNFLPTHWVNAFQGLGDLGLVLLVFQGGLTTRLDLLQENFVLSNVVALIGVMHPIVFSIASFVSVFGWDAVQGFTAGAALSTTSLGTTVAILSSLQNTMDLRKTRIGTVLLSAAMIDDVTGLIMASVVGQISDERTGGGDVGLVWMALRPILASTAIAIVAPLVAVFVILPIYRRALERVNPVFVRGSMIVVIVAMLFGMLALSDVLGSSMLFGAYMTGCSLRYVDSERVCTDDISTGGNFTENICAGCNCTESKWTEDTRDARLRTSLSFENMYTMYLEPSNTYIFVPLFFASIGGSVPFLALFKPAILWKGMLYSLLMFLGKFMTGIAILYWPIEGEPRSESPQSAERPIHPAPDEPVQEEDDLRGKGKGVNHNPSGFATVPEGNSQVSSDATTLPSDHEHRAVEAVAMTNAPAPSSGVLGLPIYPALLLASAMVSRGEISLLIAQVGRVILEEEAFLVVVWAVIICTLIGPLSTGLLVRYRATRIIEGPWGAQ